MFQHQDSLVPNKSSGFTLVEALVALMLLTIALIPILWQSTNALKLSGSISNSLTAAHLAQEGIEVVHAIRDTNWFTTQPFDAGLNPRCNSGCRVQSDSDNIDPDKAPVPGAAEIIRKLKIDPGSNMYQYTNGTDTIFSRAVTITPVSAFELKVVSTVTWTERGVPKTFFVESYLFDWVK